MKLLNGLLSLMVAASPIALDATEAQTYYPLNALVKSSSRAERSRKQDKNDKDGKESKKDKKDKKKDGKKSGRSRKDRKARFESQFESPEQLAQAVGSLTPLPAPSYASLHITNPNQTIVVGDSVRFSEQTFVSSGDAIAFDQPHPILGTSGQYQFDFYIPYFAVVSALPFTVGTTTGSVPAQVSFQLQGAVSEQPITFVGSYEHIEDNGDGQYRLYGYVSGSYVFTATEAQAIDLKLLSGPDSLVLNPSSNNETNNAAYLVVRKL